MREILKRGLLFSAIVVCLPLVTTSRPAPPPPDTVPDISPADPRLQKLRAFFSRFDCPALFYAHVFLEASDRHSLDWRLLPSISYLESTGGKAAANNNLFGWDSGRARFKTPTAGIHAVAHRLSVAKRYRGKSLDEKLAIYNSRAEYAAKVKSVMLQIDRSR